MYDDEEESELAKEFKKHFVAHTEEIQDKIDQATKLLEEAIQLSEQYNVPIVDSPICFKSADFVPMSFGSSKFGSLTESEFSNITSIWGSYVEEYIRYGGWQTSSDKC